MFFVTVLLMGCKSPQKNIEKAPSFDWIEGEHTPDFSWAEEVGAKAFPTDKQLSANLFGAETDTTVLSTAYIQAAIDSCFRLG